MNEPLWPAADVLRLWPDKLASNEPVFTRHPLYPKQAAIVDDPARFTITEATTKAGKTMSHIEWLLEEAVAIGYGNHWWVATTSFPAGIAYRRTVDRLRGFIDSSGVMLRVAAPIAFKKHDTEHWIEANLAHARRVEVYFPGMKRTA